MIRRPPRSTLFPYTPLSRSVSHKVERPCPPRHPHSPRSPTPPPTSTGSCFTASSTRRWRASGRSSAGRDHPLYIGGDAVGQESGAPIVDTLPIERALQLPACAVDGEVRVGARRRHHRV